MFPKFTVCLVILLAFAQATPADDNDDLKSVDQGVKLFREGDFQGALEAFLQAEQANPDNLLAKYNSLTTMANANKLSEMENKLNNEWAPLGKETAIRAGSAYNMGTSLLDIAAKADKEDQLPSKARELNSAINWLRQALLDEPADINSKNNLEFANKLLEKLAKQEQDQENQEQNQQQKNKDKQDQNKEKQQQQDEQQDNEKDNNQQQNQKENQQKQQQQKPEKQDQKEKDISKSTAQNLLKAAKDAEKKAMKMLRAQMNKKNRKRPHKGRDW